MFEAADRVGGHAHTVRVESADETHDLDTGFMVFNDRNYPNFERLIGRLGVAHQPSDMSFSVSDGRGSFEYSSSSLNGMFANRRHVLSSSFTRMLAEVPRFQRAALELLRAGDERISLRAWLQAHAFLAVSSWSGCSSRRPRRCGPPILARCGPSRRCSWRGSSITTACSTSAAGPAGGRSAEDRHGTWRR